MKKLALLLVLISLVVSGYQQQPSLFGVSGICHPLPTANPQELGMSTQKLNHITEVMQKHIDQKRMAGMVAVAARYGKIAYFEALGRQDMKKKTPMRKDSIFWIASMSKPITSVAVMMLYEEGKFALNEPVSNYLPVFADMEVGVEKKDETEGKVTYSTVPVEREVTILDLLRHTSGLGYGDGDTEMDKRYRKAMDTDENVPLAEWVGRLRSVPLKFQPGTRWEYGISTDVLERLVEVVSGMSFDRFFEERIFGPLGMKDTAFYVPDAKRDRLATLYSPGYVFNEEKQDLKNLDMTLKPSPVMDESYFGKSVKRLSGGGGLVSTAGDYLRFCQMLLNNGELDGVRILKKETVALMTRDHIGNIPKLDWMQDAFGLGFRIHDTSQDGPSKGTYRWGGSCEHQVLDRPERRTYNDIYDTNHS